MKASAPFTFYSGSIRYKILFSNPRTFGSFLAAYYVPNPPSTETDPGNLNEIRYAGAPLAVTNMTQDSGLEIEIPFYSIYNQNVIFSTNDNGVPDTAKTNGLLILKFQPYSADYKLYKESCDFSIFIAAGDDYRVSYLVAPPITNESKYTPPQ
jgi:hypothetical protein